ncbi:putative RNA recognition motif domain, nucleotide-binding alpha-beta plait domain superfamily [Helianthus annuus]|nr:putative RNA recognition motif domain, nucleotide-binding alpha-beta plait domain superfamily [Helianthus annuus]KAJ0956021.1 putative RNA recognition motif domain, nucleotide-binding alpha-beta plait domain superfamily [Helianthus annuus]
MEHNTFRGGEEDDGGGPWRDVQYQKYRRKPGNGVEMTFIVQNLPDRTTKMVLWRAFQPYGFVSDAYVARKKDKRGNSFGFVRYKGVENLDVTLAGMNTVKIFEAKVLVSLAKYDKNHNKFVYTSKFVGEKIWRPKDPAQSYQCNKENTFRNAEIREGQSFASLFHKDNQVPSTGAKTILVENKGSKYPLHCMGRSIHGIVKDINTLKGLNSLLNNGGLTDYGLSYVGGFNVLVTLGNPRIVNEVMANKSDCLVSVFSQFKVWKGEDIPLDRIVTLRITGVPVHLRDNVLFDQIGGLFGRVVQESAFSWLGSNNDENTVLVLAPPGKRIEESVVLRWEGRSYIIWVSEDFTVWKPEIEGESSMDNEGYDSNECSSDGSYEIEEQSNGPMSVDEEEGEFRHHECTNPASEGPVDFPADGSPTPERLLSPECGRFRNEKSAEGSETVRISGNNDYGGHGEEFSHGKHNDDVGTEKMAAEKVGGDSQFLEERGTDHVTHNPVSEPTP